MKITKELEEIAINTIRSTSKYRKDLAWYELAAAAIVHDLCDRRGIKREMWNIDKDILDEMQSIWSVIINKLFTQKAKESNPAMDKWIAALQEGLVTDGNLNGDDVDYTTTINPHEIELRGVFNIEEMEALTKHMKRYNANS